jgi:hypothetical protein
MIWDEVEALLSKSQEPTLFFCPPNGHRLVEAIGDIVRTTDFDFTRSMIVALYTAQQEGIASNKVAYQARDETIGDLKDKLPHWSADQIANSIDTYVTNLIARNKAVSRYIEICT